MKTLLAVFMLIFSNFANASCPNLKGYYLSVNDPYERSVAITQNAENGFEKYNFDWEWSKDELRIADGQTGTETVEVTDLIHQVQIYSFQCESGKLVHHYRMWYLNVETGKTFDDYEGVRVFSNDVNGDLVIDTKSRLTGTEKWKIYTTNFKRKK